MKIVHIGYKYGLNNTGGAAIAATRLHKELLERGIESHYVCILQCEDGVNVHEMPRRGIVLRKTYLLLTKMLRGIWKFTAYRRSIPLNILPMIGLEQLLAKIKPDVIHIHYTNFDVMSFRQLGNLKCRVVINLHDLFLINIIEPHPAADRRYICGLTMKNSTWIERWLFDRKRKSIDRLRPCFIGPSAWVCECARQSIIGRNLASNVISNLVDKKYVYDSHLSKWHEKFVILFGAYGGRKNRYKGFSDLEEALGLLPEAVKDDCELWIFGEDAPDCFTRGIKTIFKGNVSSSEALRNIYHSADVFAFPSRQETQGMTKMEAMLCGLPVVAFDRTACAEGIVHKGTGWVADDGNIQQYADGIYYFYRESKGPSYSGTRSRVACQARLQWDTDTIVSAVLSVYRNVESGHKCMDVL